MNKEILILTDYKGVFGSKHFDTPYRSGFDKGLLKKYFKNFGYKVEFIKFSELDLKDLDLKSKIILYTSSEDLNSYYKSYIEDIILSCELKGAFVLPPYKYLRAHHNKVFMEMLRGICNLSDIKNIQAFQFGTLEEVLQNKNLRESQYPKVLKLAEGASGENVELVENYNDLIKKIKKICKTKNLYYDLWDYGRHLKHKGYILESKHRKKFVVQDFISGLKNDWKLYVFYDDIFIFYRPIFKRRKFKASGGGYDNYFYGAEANAPDGIFDFALKIRKEFDVPQLSLDIAYDGRSYYLFEFQFLYFGTAGIPYSKEYYSLENNKWVEKKMCYDQEFFYSKSICKYLDKRIEPIT